MQEIEVRRKFRGKGRILVEPGQRVTFSDPIATIEYIPGRLVRCNVAYDLGCEPQDVSQYITHKPGEWVKKGTELVSYDHFFSKRSAYSPVSGFYVFASKVLGYIFIREPSVTDSDQHKKMLAGEDVDKDRKVMKAGFSGVVSSVNQENQIVISSEGYRFQGVVGFGQQNFGKLLLLGSLNDELQASEVPDDFQDQVIVIKGWPSLDALQKISKSGAVGLVSGNIPIEVLQAFCPEEPLLNLGHQMPISMTLIMMQKFGETMTQVQYDELKKLEGKWCLVDGNTQLRAGCKRPEILIPMN